MKKKFSKILGVGLTLALLCSLLLTAAPVAAISTPAVTLDTYVISQGAVYTLTFQVITGLATTDRIVVTFPTGTTIPASIVTSTDPDVKVGAGPGIGTAGYGLTDAACALDATGLILTITPPTAINNAAWVQIVIGTGNTLTNPAAPASYNLTVGTQDTSAIPVVIEAAVTSAAYTLVIPVIPPVPGVVAGYNTAGIKLVEVTGAGAIGTALGTASVVQVVAGDGTYDEDVTVGAGQTLEALNAGLAVIRDVNLTAPGGSVNITGALATVSGLTIDGSTATGYAVQLNVAGGATVSNCTIGGRAGVPALVMAAGVTATPAVSSGNTINAVAGQSGIVVNTGAEGTSTGDTIAVVGTAFGIANSGTLTVTNGTISGTGGTGIWSVVPAAVTTISGTTISSMAPAILVTDGTLTMGTASTISGCGSAVVGAEVPSISVAALTIPVTQNTVQISGSTIENSVDDILQVTLNADFVFVNFNTLTGNALSFDNNDAVNTLDATNNWWGTTAGPAVASTGLVLTTPFLTASVANQQLAVAVAGGTTTSWQTTAGVDILLSAAVPASTLAAAKYTANPAGTVVPAGTVTQYFDVYRQGVALAAADTITIRFYGIQSTGAEVYAWSAAQGTWVLASGQVIDQFRGCVTVTITLLSSPSSANLGGLPFALVEPAAVAATLGTPVITAPESGATDVRLTPTFVWEPVTDAEGYYFELADNVNFVSPMIKLDGELGRLFVTAYAYVGELEYSTAYYWRVKATSGAFNPWIQWVQSAHFDVESDWTSGGAFITMDEPEEELPPVVVEEAPPVIIEPIVEVITPAATEITPSWIYVIIGVGGVLVIALLVLIVRTRRVA